MFDATWTLLSWNRLWAALFGDSEHKTGRNRNLVWQLFTAPAGESRVVRTAEERQAFAASSAVADLRAAAGRYPADAELQALVADLCRVGERFAALWQAHTVDAHVSERKTIAHPEIGLVTADADALALLRVLGTQALRH